MEAATWSLPISPWPILTADRRPPPKGGFDNYPRQWDSLKQASVASQARNYKYADD